MLPTDPSRQIENLFKIGRVTGLDCSKTPAVIKVRFDTDEESDWFPISSQKAGNAFIWMPPEIGDQVLIASLSGSQNQLIYLCAVHYDQNQHGLDENTMRVQFRNGDMISHSNNTLNIDITRNIDIKARGDINMMADGVIRMRAKEIHLN